MPAMRIVLEGDGSNVITREDINSGRLIELQNQITITALPGGMASGKTSVAFVFELPDGKKVFAETSLALFQTAAKAFTARYGEMTE